MRTTLVLLLLATLTAAEARADRYGRGSIAFQERGCALCHEAGWKGSDGARDLAPRSIVLAAGELARALAAPAARRTDGDCGRAALSTDEIDDLVHFLRVRAATRDPLAAHRTRAISTTTALPFHVVRVAGGSGSAATLEAPAPPLAASAALADAGATPELAAGTASRVVENTALERKPHEIAPRSARPSPASGGTMGASKSAPLAWLGGRR